MASNDADQRHARWVLLASFVLLAVAGGSLYIVVVGLKTIAGEFGWPRSIPALGYSLAMLGTGVGGILMGRWSDRSGVAKPALLGIAMISAGCLLAGTSNGAGQLLFAHALCIGLLGNACLFGPLLANITKWFRHRRGVAVAIVASGQTAAGMLWPPLYRLTIDEFGWRETYLLFAAIVALSLTPLVLILRRRPPVEVAARGAANLGGSAALPNGFGMPLGVVLTLLCVAIVGCCVAMAMPTVHLVSHATDLGFSAARGAEVLSLTLACAVASRLIWGMVSDKIGGLATLAITSTWQLATIGILSTIDSLPGLYLAGAVFGLGYGGIVPCYTIIIRESFPITGIGMRIGVVLLFGTVGMALGGWLGAYIFDWSGNYDSAFLTGMCFNALNLAIVFFLMYRRAQLPRLALPT